MKIVKRILTALSTAALVVAGIWYLPLDVLLPVMIAVVALVHLEFSQMVARKYAILVWPGVIAGVLHLVGVFYVGGGSSTLAIVCALAMLVLFRGGDRPVEALATTLLGFFYVPWMLSYLIAIPHLYGAKMLLYVVAMVKFSDMGGFAVGLTIGRHKLCPTISPNKTWEGFAGSLLAGVIMSVAFMPLTGFSAGKSVLLGLVAAAVGTLGDLIESRFKRQIGVKDSATFMPAGLGGFLDMFDSLVFVPALIYSFL